MLLFVDWENKLQCLLMCTSRCRIPNKWSRYCTPMANSSPKSHGNLEHIYTPDTFVLHGLAHMVGSEMTRGYPAEQPVPLPTMASEPKQLLKLEVFGLFRKQDSGLHRAQELQGDHVFSHWSNTLSAKNTVEGRDFSKVQNWFLSYGLYALWCLTVLDNRERKLVKSLVKVPVREIKQPFCNILNIWVFYQQASFSLTNVRVPEI